MPNIKYLRLYVKMFPPLKNLTKARKRLKKSDEIAEKNNIGDSPQKECKCKRFKKKKE